MEESAYKNVSLDQVLLPGVDNPLTPTQYIPSSAIAALNIVRFDQTSFPAPVSPNASSSTTVNHNLGYNPEVIAFVSASTTGTSWILPYRAVDAITGVNMYEVNYEFVPGGVTFYHRYFSGVYVNQTDYITYRFIEPFTK